MYVCVCIYVCIYKYGMWYVAYDIYGHAHVHFSTPKKGDYQRKGQLRADGCATVPETVPETVADRCNETLCFFIKAFIHRTEKI